MSEEHANVLAELAAERETQKLASIDEIKKLGKRKIFPNANYPYARKMDREEYETSKQQLQTPLSRRSLSPAFVAAWILQRTSSATPMR